MKNKKSVIIISILVIIVVAAITLFLVFKDKIKDNKIENTYTAYVDINPLIKLSFKVFCQNNDCTEPIVTDTELVNEDAKKVYKDLVLENKTLKESIQLLANTVKDNNIAFKEVHIYTNYDNENEFKINNVDYNISLNIKKDDDLEKFIDELVVQKGNLTEKDIIVPILYPRKVSEMPFEFQIMTDDCTLFKLMEYPELYVSRGRIKISISGPAELVNVLPENTSIDDDFYIKAIVDVNDYTLGEHTTYLNITSENSSVTISSPSSIKVKYEVREKGDIHFCYKVD